MKFRVTMKDPDTLHDAIEDAVVRELDAQSIKDKDERAALLEIRQEKIGNVAGRWFAHGEYLTVEIDTDAGTCTVVEGKDG